ncbi:unnamed protein product [Brachionus calyciflorus]|uniref:Uncharacterized protein n=1 Tax=Brachionus calyciflorus TaxID=104777 RepID=A0A814MT78_9BILA|nr:unnamed protein product [Brachionus calyciflorus]
MNILNTAVEQLMSEYPVTAQTLIDSFERVAQSYKDVKLNENNALTAHIIIARLPSGSGRKILYLKKRETPYTKKKDQAKKAHENSFQNYCENQACIIHVYNNDNLCAVRAIIIGKAYADNNPITTELVKPYSKQLEQQLIRVVKDLFLSNQPCGLEEIKRIEAYFRDFQITIINCDGKLDKKPIYIGPKNIKHIYLCYTGTHYNVISSMKRFYNRSYYCDFNNLEDHFCIKCCTSCNRTNCNESVVHQCLL